MLCSNEAFFILAGGGGRMSLVLISNQVVLHP